MSLQRTRRRRSRRMASPEPSQGRVHARSGEHRPSSINSHLSDAPPGGGPLGNVSGWVASLLSFSPFAFASTDLEQKYQDYQSAHVGSHVGIACWLLGVIWVSLPTLGWRKSVDYPRMWVFSLPMALCFAVGCFSIYAPGAFRRNSQACSFAIVTMLMLIDDEVNAFLTAYHVATGNLQAVMCRAFFGPDFNRLLVFMFFAVGFPVSGPAWGLAHVAMWVTSGYNSAGRRECLQVPECPTIGSLVSSALQSIMVAYPGAGAQVEDATLCQMWVMFWRIQAEVMGAVVGVLRDVAWRRSFLRTHPHLIGTNGAARAAAWPFGSPRTVGTCVALLLWLLHVEVTAFDFRVLALLRNNQAVPV